MEPVSRRNALRIAGCAGLGATLSACAAAAQPSTPSPQAPQPATPTLATESPALAPPSSPAPAGASALMLCRDAWGARPARAGGTRHTITRMTVHHTAVTLGDNRNSPERLRQHQRYHQDQHGWIDIAYHIGVDRDGNIFELRTTDLAGDTATEYDTTGHFLVVCEGNFDEEEVSEAQLDGAAMAFAWATQNFPIGSETLRGHRDFAATSCPGASLYARVASGDLKGRIDDLLSGGTVNLRKVCGPEAAAIVADIEAGR